MSEIIQAISTAHTNGGLIDQMARLYIKDRYNCRVLDPTPGRGGMWTVWQPRLLTLSDHDYTQPLPIKDRFDLIVFDPPYVAKGGRATSASVADHDDRYGRSGRGTHPDGRKTAVTPAEIKAGIEAGMTNLAALLERGGQLWVKSADYVTSGRVVWGNHDARVKGRELGLEQVDEVHLRSTSPQPAGRTQRHARRGMSTLTIWRKP